MILCAAILSCLLMPALARADGDGPRRYRHNNLVFDVPDGFEADGDIVRSKEWGMNDLDAPLYRLADGGDVPGGDDALTRWGDEQLAERARSVSGRRYVPTAWQKADLAGPVTVFVGGGRLVDQNGLTAGAVVAVLMRAGGRGEMVWSESIGTPDAERLGTLTRGLVGFAGRLEFVNLGAKTLLGAPTPGSLAGPWWGLEAMPMGDGSVMSNTDVFVFNADGTFCEGVPPGGVRAINAASIEALAMDDSDAVGHYVVKGDRLTLSYASGRVQGYGVSVEDGQTWLKEEGSPMVLGPVRAPPAGWRFAGRAHWGTHLSMWAAGGGGFLSRTDLTTVFAADGTYVRAVSTDTVGDSATGTVGVASGSGERGTYAVGDGEIVLRADDGKERRMPLLIVLEMTDTPTLWAGDDVDLAPGTTLPPAKPAVNPLAPPSAPVNPLAPGVR